MVVELDIHEEVFLPVYRPLLHKHNDITFLWGGRDAGRTHFVAQQLIIDCMTKSRFRCILVKKTHVSIKDAQWQTIKDIVEFWGISHLFKFKENPLTIECINGNRFIARGCDNTENIKSIKDPTDVWYEEGNQLDLQDFITISTSLRSNDVEIRQWFNFNPETEIDYKEHWLYKMFFQKHDELGEYTFESTWDIELPNKEVVSFKYAAVHSTYKNNPYCKPQRIAFLEQLAVLDPYYYQCYTLGMWGKRKADKPFVVTYKPEVHKGKTQHDPNLDTYLSFDFNLDPITCGVYQRCCIVACGVTCNPKKAARIVFLNVFAELVDI